jgi:hypothetical protein
VSAGGLFRGPSVGEYYCVNPTSSVLRAYDRDQVYLQSVRPLGRNLEIEVFLTLSFFIRLFISNNNSTVVFAAASIADVMVPISYGT